LARKATRICNIDYPQEAIFHQRLSFLDAQLQEILMRRTPCSLPKHPQEVIPAVAALRRYRLEIEINTQIGTQPLDYAP
jgi:hypothetical protein